MSIIFETRKEESEWESECEEEDEEKPQKSWSQRLKDWVCSPLEWLQNKKDSQINPWQSTETSVEVLGESDVEDEDVDIEIDVDFDIGLDFDVEVDVEIAPQALVAVIRRILPGYRLTAVQSENSEDNCLDEDSGSDVDVSSTKSRAVETTGRTDRLSTLGTQFGRAVIGTDVSSVLMDTRVEKHQNPSLNDRRLVSGRCRDRLADPVPTKRDQSISRIESSRKAGGRRARKHNRRKSVESQEFAVKTLKGRTRNVPGDSSARDELEHEPDVWHLIGIIMGTSQPTLTPRSQPDLSKVVMRLCASLFVRLFLWHYIGIFSSALTSALCSQPGRVTVTRSLVIRLCASLIVRLFLWPYLKPFGLIKYPILIASRHLAELGLRSLFQLFDTLSKVRFLLK